MNTNMEASHSKCKETNYCFESNPFDFESNGTCPDEVQFQGISNISDLFNPSPSLEPPHKPDEDTIKMFVGQVPLNYDEIDLLQLLEPFGKVYDLRVLRDKTTGKSKGCCFVTFLTRKAALSAQNALHNTRVLPGMYHPVQMRPANIESQADRKLFVGMLPRNFSESDVRSLFSPFGAIEECTVLRDINRVSKGCAFVTYLCKQSAYNAVKSMHHCHAFEECSSPIVVKFADTLKDKEQRKLQFIQYSSASQNSFPSDYQNVPLECLTYLLNSSNFLSQPLSSRSIPNLVHNNFCSQGSNWAQTNFPGLTRVDNLDLLSNNATNQNFLLNILASLSINDIKHLNNTWFQLHGGVENTCQSQIPLENHFTNSSRSLEQLISRYTWDKLLASTDQKQIEGPEGANLFIYHLPREFDDLTLSQLFQPYGRVLSAKVFIDKNTQKSKCFGFVSYDNVLSANIAIQHLNGFSVSDKRLKVEVKRKKH